MARKISFVNYKGGVGKTSIVVNVAGCLAQQGKRVLIVDCDPQSNSSIWLMRLDRWNVLNKRPGLTLLSTFSQNESTLTSVCIHNVVCSIDGSKTLPGLDLIPTTFNLMDLEHEYHEDPEHPSYVKFYEQLREIENNYDYILFDCPPNAFRGTQCALFSSDEIYVPANPDALSLIGLSLITEKAHLFNQESERFRVQLGVEPAQICGMILNAIKVNVNIDVPVQRMEMRLEHYVKQQKAAQCAHIFKAFVRDAIMVRRAVIMGLPIALLNRGEGVDNVREDYEKIAHTISNLQVKEKVLL